MGRLRVSNVRPALVQRAELKVMAEQKSAKTPAYKPGQSFHMSHLSGDIWSL